MDDTHHDHSQPTHTAKCDACEYVAKTHAHDDDLAAENLSYNLAGHNKREHGKETEVENIKGAVAAKMSPVVQ